MALGRSLAPCPHLPLVPNSTTACYQPPVRGTGLPPEWCLREGHPLEAVSGEVSLRRDWHSGHSRVPGLDPGRELMP